MSNENSDDKAERDSTMSVDNLKKEKRVMKMQLTKIYTRLVPLMSGDEPAREEILQSLEEFESKKFDVLGVIEALIGIYREIGDEKSAVKAEDELDNVTSDANKDASSVKEFLLTTFAKPSLSKTKEPDVMAQQYEGHSVLKSGGLDRKMQPIQIPKFNGDKTRFESFWRFLGHLLMNQTSRRNIK